MSADDLTMIEAELPVLPAGEYTVRWQARDPTDNHTERGTFGFTVVEASTTPTHALATPSPAPATDEPATPERTEQPKAAPTPSPQPSPSPTPGDAEPTTGMTDVLMALVLAGVVVGGLALYLLRRR